MSIPTNNEILTACDGIIAGGGVAVARIASLSSEGQSGHVAVASMLGIPPHHPLKVKAGAGATQGTGGGVSVKILCTATDSRWIHDLIYRTESGLLSDNTNLGDSIQSLCCCLQEGASTRVIDHLAGGATIGA